MAELTRAQKRHLKDLDGGFRNMDYVSLNDRFPAAWLNDWIIAGYVEIVGEDFFHGKLVKVTDKGREAAGIE